MPHYYFHLHSHGLFLEDHEGMELPSNEAAIAEVQRTIAEVASEAIGPWPVEFWIADHKGSTLLTVPVQGGSTS